MGSWIEILGREKVVFWRFLARRLLRGVLGLVRFGGAASGGVSGVVLAGVARRGVGVWVFRAREGLRWGWARLAGRWLPARASLGAVGSWRCSTTGAETHGHKSPPTTSTKAHRPTKSSVPLCGAPPRGVSGYRSGGDEWAPSRASWESGGAEAPSYWLKSRMASWAGASRGAARAAMPFIYDEGSPLAYIVQLVDLETLRRLNGG